MAIHLPLFVLYPLLFIYVHNIKIAYVSFLEVVIAYVSFLSAFLLLWVALKVCTKDKIKSSIITSLVVILFFQFMEIKQWIREWLVGSQFIDVISLVRQFYSGPIVKSILLPMVIAIVVGLSVYIVRSRVSFDKFSQFLTVVSSVLIIQLIVQLGMNSMGSTKSKQDFPPLDQQSLIQIKEEVQYKPNIYYIIVDGYANQHVLSSFYQYDNTPFISWLEEQGFYVATEGRSNYDVTRLSIPSMLTASYLKEWGYTQIIEKTRKSSIIQLIKSLGYSFIYTQSVSYITGAEELSDYTLQGSALSDYFMTVLRKTPLVLLEEKLMLLKTSVAHHTLDVVNFISTMTTKVQSPFFVFGHLICPHPPYLFDKEGNIIEDSDLELGGDEWRDTKRYRDQLIFTNTLLKKMITTILSLEKTPPVIIIQSDHGPASLANVIQREKPSTDYVVERMKNFTAVYANSEMTSQLYPDMTPVNTLRFLSNAYFNTDMTLLEDKCFFSTTQNTVIDVTNVVNNYSFEKNSQ